MDRPGISGGRRFLFAVGVLVIVLAAAEVIIRVAGVDTYFQNRFFVLNRALDYPDVFEKDYDLFWKLRSSRTVTSKFFEGKTYRINAHGLRGEEIDEVKTAPRILALGNSCTFGWGVPQRETYASQLTAMLGERYEVINGGVPGYSSLQGKRFFKRDLLSLQPDLILILFAWNDHWAAAAQIADKDQQPPPRPLIAAQNLLSRLHLYRLLKKLLLSAIEKDPDVLFDRSQPVYRVGLDDYYSNLRALCGVARSHGIRPVLITSPIPSLEKYYPAGSVSNLHTYHGRYNDAVRRLARDERVELIDLAAEFDRHDDLYDNAVRDPIHFNAKGHRIAAELIAEYLRKNP
ncbi:MAG: GDSL-type esterase/lipase family protein [candidate division Zixibacteria bacterium]|nr:GDSL-type esterase/lipase family protein [candidate division Zixibacteria bacterium]